MLRIVLLQVGVVLLPFAGYALFAWVTRRSGPLKAETWAGAPLYVLAGLSVVALISSLFMFDLLEGAEPGSTYSPARFEDGQLIPPSYSAPEDADTADTGSTDEETEDEPPAGEDGPESAQEGRLERPDTAPF